MKVIVAGDFCQKLRVYDAVKNRQFAKLFDDIRPILNAADFSIVNFEFPIVSSPDNIQPILKCGPTLQGTIEAVDAVKYAGFNVCTLANNHILDQGEYCCLDTKERLEEAGIKTVGVGKNRDEASRVLYLTIASETLAIVNCCEHEFSIATDISVGANPLNPIAQYYKIQEAKSKADYVLVIVHGGHEHFPFPSLRMKETYRFFVDAGADVVINHHQHCYSGYEIYCGSPIIYGLGNLCFDHITHRNEIWNVGYMAELFFEEGKCNLKKLHPYTQCSDEIGVHLIHDGSLFWANIQELNSIISSSEKLSQMLDKYYEIKERQVILRFLPFYYNKFLRKLYTKILPSFGSRKKFLPILNYIECESHFETTLRALKNVIVK